jgi:hypothetical protein
MILKHRLFPLRVGDWAECTHVVAVRLGRAEQSRARQIALVTDTRVGTIAGIEDKFHLTRMGSHVHVNKIIVIVGS